MKTLSTLFALILGTNITYAMTCTSLDTLISASETYLCKSQNGAVCINFGNHTSLQLPSIHVFSVDDNSTTFPREIMVHGPVLDRCTFSGAGGLRSCTHTSVGTNAKTIEGYRYRAPDFWDARSSTAKFQLDKVQGKAESRRSGSQSKSESHELTSCVKQ